MEVIKMDVQLSIIVPIYKVEQYLSKCIDSVLQQKFRDFELILVDDGSPDNCPKICDDYALTDKRIKVIHKKNGGLSDARNIGMENVNGKYIIFLDGDDFLTENCLHNIYNILMSNDDPDLLIGTFNYFFLNKDTLLNRIKLLDILEYIDDYRKLLSAFIRNNDEIPWSASRNVFKYKIIAIHNLKFEKGLIGAEDCDFFMKYIKYIKSYKIIEYPIINYRVSRQDSITNNIKFDAIMGQLEIFNKYFHEYNKIAIELNDVSIIYNYFAEKFANTISTLHFLTKDEEVFLAEKKVRDNANILKYTRGAKYVIAKIIWQIFGYYKGSQIMRRIRL